ncbi:ubiquitin-associated protein 1-like [Lacerta agilis]|uniref:ubiquitin-associated protein 1-like n=1 Tax=Lacerta agilis TaxID=80427 RepID=UPI0014196FAD|nr:ubiquitin-associated protein 1-like [Lacerta agilis]
MNCLQGVPFRVTVSVADDSTEEANFVSAPEFEVPDCMEVLMCAMHDFSLEKKVLYWVDSASRQDTPWYEVTTDVVPTAPPCWLLLLDSKENFPEAAGHKLTSAVPIRRCANLCAAAEKFSCTVNKSRLAKKVSKDGCLEEQGCSGGEESPSASSVESDGEEKPFSDSKRVPGTLPRFLSLPQCRPKTSPVLLATPSESISQKPLLVKQRQSMLLFNNVKHEFEGARKKLTAFMLPRNQAAVEPTMASRAFSLHQRSRSSRNLKYGPTSDVSLVGTLAPMPPTTPCCSARPLTVAGLVPPIQKHKPTVPSLSPYSCLPPPPGVQELCGSHRTHPDSTADLLSALSQEERDLIEPVLALGYPIRRAILALQKTGRQSLGQFLSYLSACDKLLKQGYEEAQVEEAMEMFQNSEKAAEFLHLLVQFNDMGFQQADIKEVLLLCENHRDKALEELMTRTQ